MQKTGRSMQTEAIRWGRIRRTVGRGGKKGRPRCVERDSKRLTGGRGWTGPREKMGFFQ